MGTLTFAASTPCASIDVAPENELAALLQLPNANGVAVTDQDTSIRIDTSDAADGTCKLRVRVFRAALDRLCDDSATATTNHMSVDNTKAPSTADLLDIAAAVHANLALAVTPVADAAALPTLRGASATTTPLFTLERMAFRAAVDSYDVVLRGSPHDNAAQAASTLMLYGSACPSKLQDATFVLQHVVPRGIDAGALAIATSDDVAVSMGHALACASVFQMTARAPLLQADDVADALRYVHAIDANVAALFGTSATTRSAANVELHAASPGAMLLDSDALALNATHTAQMPSQTMLLSVVAGLAALLTMLVAVAIAKTHHEKRSVAKHRNASQAAQIHRVSLRMAKSPSMHRRNAFGEEMEETKDEEHDSLL